MMKSTTTRIKILLLCCCLSATAAYSQVFKGRVTTDSGNPIPFASLYIHELSSGLIADDEGRFSRALSPGTYVCEVSSLGYGSQLITIEMGNHDLERDIILHPRVYELAEVSITRGDEDPAYQVMRQAIAHAPYYRNYVKSYTAGTYQKGTGKVTNIPALLKLSKSAREDAKKYTGRLFVLEEQRKVKFTAPNTWDNEVLAYSNSFPDEIQVSIEASNVNLYQPTFGGKISPLNPRAFSYYQFKLEGYYEEGKHLVNKIRVIPRRDNPELVDGYIYIIDDLWCLSAIDLKLSNPGFDATINVTCKEVKPSVFMNTSASVKTNIHLMGIKAEASYLSAIHYTDVEINTTPATAIDQDDNQTKRDAYRLAKQVRKSLEAADTTQVGDKYERKSRTLEMKRDSLAEKRDSTYWAAVRSIPLKPEEVQSFAYKEELTLQKQAIARDTTRRKNPLKEPINILINGKEIRSRNDNLWLKLGKLSSYVPEYNFVDGLWVGARLTAGVKLGEESQLTFTPEGYYTTARHNWLGSGTLELDYAPRHLGKLVVSGGVLSVDFNEESGENRLINGLASLYFGRNEVKFYDKRYLSVSNDFELTNGVLLTTGLSWQKRKALENTVHHSLFGREARPNLPGHPDYTIMPDNQLLKATAILQYTPPRYYWMHQGRKRYERSNLPSVSLKYERAFPHGGSSTLSPSYHLTEFTAWQSMEYGMFNRLAWLVNAGAFWDTDAMQFPDYKHFTTTRLGVTDHSFSRTLALPRSYSLSTDSRWAQAYLSWYTPYLLLKQLPFLKRQRFDEALHLRSVMVHRRPPYWEAGYSVGFLTLARAGVFVGFEGMDYQAVGISVSIPFIQSQRVIPK